MKNRIAFLYGTSLFALAISLAAPAHAQLEEAAREAERLNREQQIRQDVQRMKDETSARSRTQIEVPPPPAPKGKGSGCKNIRDIELEGANLMPAPKKESLITPYEGKCLGVNEIQRLLGDITAYYITNGYAAARAYIPEQDLNSGKLKVLVVEGIVKKVKLEDGDRRSINMGLAFPDIEGNVLNLRDFEQGLDNVNRMTSNNATMDILPGELPGESVVLIKNQPAFPLGASFSLDSYGSRGTGRYQGSSTVMANGLLGLNEQFSYTRRQSVFPTTAHNQNSDSDSFFFSIPYGRTMLSFGYSDSTYQSRLITAAGTILPLEGTSQNTYGKLEHTVWRSQASKWTISEMLTQKISDNYAGGLFLGVSSRTLAVLDLDTNLSTQGLGGAINIGGGFAFGMPMLGALNDQQNLPDSVPHAQFKKLKLNASYSLPFEVAKRSANFTTSFTGQYAFDALYGSEQISVGGPYSVRGFYGTSLANDHGYYLRNDLSFVQPVTTIGKTAIALKPYIGLDLGSVSGVPSKTPNGTLVGGAAGFSILAGAASFDIFTSTGFVHPDALRDEGSTTFARASISF